MWSACFWQSLAPAPRQPNTTTLRGERRWFVDLNWFSDSENRWFTPPSWFGGVRHICTDLYQPEESMLFKGTVGLSALSVATNLFTSVICSETLENPMKQCCWNTQRSGKWPEDKHGLVELHCDCVVMTSLAISFGLSLDAAACDFVQCYSYYLPTFPPCFCLHSAVSSSLEL